MNIDWSSVLIVIVCVATVWIDEKVKEWKRKEASPFPLCKLTDEEGELLSHLYKREKWETLWLCYMLNRYALDEVGSQLKRKIMESLRGEGTLTSWLITNRPFRPMLDQVTLRKQWIVALLEYNNMQEKLK